MPVLTADQLQLETFAVALNELAKPLPASDTFSVDVYTDQLESAVRIAFAPCSDSVRDTLQAHGHDALYRYKSAEASSAEIEGVGGERSNDCDKSDRGAWQWAMAVLDILLSIHCVLEETKSSNCAASATPIQQGEIGAKNEPLESIRRNDLTDAQFRGGNIKNKYNGDAERSNALPTSLIEDITTKPTNIHRPEKSPPRSRALIEEIVSDDAADNRHDAAAPILATESEEAGTLSLSQSMSVRKVLRVLVYAVLVPLLDTELAKSLEHYLPQTVAEVALHQKRASKTEQQRAKARARPLTSPVYNLLYLLNGRHGKDKLVAQTGREEKLAVVVQRIVVWLGAKPADTTEVTYLTAMHFAYPVLTSTLQLAYGGTDVLRPANTGSETRAEDRGNAPNGLCQKRKKFFAHLLVVLRHRMPLNVFMEAFAQLLALRGLPASLQPVCHRILTKCLLMRNGVLCLLTHLLSSCETVSDVTAAATQTMRLVINCPHWMAKSRGSYYANVCTQLYHLLHLRSGDSAVLDSISNISKRLPHAVMILVHGMVLKYPEMARTHLISRMCAALDVHFVQQQKLSISTTSDNPFWVPEVTLPSSEVWRGVGQSSTTDDADVGVNTAFFTTQDPLIIEQAIQFAVEDLHKVFVAGLAANGDLSGTEKCAMLKTMRSYIPILLSLYSFTMEYSGISLSIAINELVGKILTFIDEDEAVNALLTFLDPGSQPNTGTPMEPQDVHITFMLTSGSRSGVSYRCVPQAERNFARDCQCIIKLLGTLKRTALAGEFFVRLVEALGQVADETEEDNRRMAKQNTGNFLNGGGGLSDVDIDRKRRYLLLSQCLGQLVQTLDVSVIKRTRHVIVFAKLLATSADDETTCMALGLLTTILAGNAVTISTEDEAEIAELRGWLEPFTNHPNAEIAEIALDLITNIQTRNPLWRDLQTETDNASPTVQHSDTQLEEQAPTSAVKDDTQSLNKDMGLLPPSKNANSGTNGSTKPAAALVTEHESFSTAMLQLKDPMLPVRAHALVLLRRLLERKDESVAGKEQILFDIFITQIRQLDSYIYLAAIQGLIVLCLEDPMHSVPALCQKFIDSDKKLGESTQAKLGEVLYGIVEAGHAQTSTSDAEVSEDTQQQNTAPFVDPNAVREELTKAHMDIIVDAMLKMADSFQAPSSSADEKSNTENIRDEAKSKSASGDRYSEEDLTEKGMVVSSALAVLARVCELRCEVVAPRIADFVGCVTKVMSTYDPSQMKRIGRANKEDVQMVTVLSSTQNDSDDESDTGAADDTDNKVSKESELPADVRFPGMGVQATEGDEEDSNAADPERAEGDQDQIQNQKLVIDPCMLVRRGAVNLATMIFRGFDPYLFGLMAPSMPPLLTLLGKVGTNDADIITRTHAQVALEDANELFKSWAAMAGFQPNQFNDASQAVPHPKAVK